MIKKIVGVMLILCFFTVSACNTVKGVGEDIQSGGKALERSSGK